jgi:hypothetical protein
MKRLLVGVLLGVLVGSGAAIAAVRAFVLPPGSAVTLRAGRQTSVVNLPAVDLSCSYGILRATIGLDAAGSAILICDRASGPHSLNPNAVQSRKIFVTKYRYQVTDNHGNLVYSVNRAP